ncbi:MAG: hypothetical protein HY033_07615 [Ignavibacteriae bacterium]|nr:hypothetical protein [Ignavibacteriota bacterium]
MKNLLIIVLVTFTGCFYFGKDQYADVLEKPPSEWSSRDCLTILTSVMVHNLNDQGANVQIIATPYYPSVIKAINRREQDFKHESEDQYQLSMDTLLKASTGLYMDWQKGSLVDAKGNYLRDRTQIDSLMFMITLRNKSWPCNIPLMLVPIPGGYKMVPLASPADWPCYIPDIVDLDKRIFLQNDRGDTMKPRVVWGRKNNLLTMEETLLVMFPLRTSVGHFLQDSQNMYLTLTGFDQKIQLKFPLSLIR